jgi:hypothetical protein
MPAECAVHNSASDTITQSVEVSGWDTEAQFFVEIAELDLSDSGDATARLCHRVNSGSLVFVRLLHGPSQDAHEKGHPTPSEAYAIETPDSAGRCRVRLTPCEPRAARRPGDQTVASCI